MSDTQRGWAPPSSNRIQRLAELPDWLDQKITMFAMTHRSTPSALLADALGDAAEQWPGHEAEEIAAEEVPTETRVPRYVVLEPSISEALDDRISKLQDQGVKIEFSDLASAVITVYIKRFDRPASVISNGTLPG